MRAAGEEGVSLERIFVLAAVIEVLFLLMMPILPHTSPRGKLLEGPSFTTSLIRLLKIPGFLILLPVIFLMFWSFTVAFYYSPLELERVGIEREWILPIQSLGPLIEIPLFLGLRRFIARIGIFPCLFIGCVCMALRHGIFVVSPEPSWLIASYLLMGISIVLYLIPVSLEVDEMAPEGIRATAQAIVLFCGPGLGNLVGNMYSGWLADRSGGELGGVFQAGMATAGLAAILLPLSSLLERRRRRLRASS